MNQTRLALPSISKSAARSATTSRTRLTADSDRTGKDAPRSPDLRSSTTHSAAVVQTKPSPRLSVDEIDRKPSSVGVLPTALRRPMESASGFRLDDVRVHYNSPRPVALSALAYAQGSEIHLGPGQERHLPHEAWHVIQQKQGRVRGQHVVEGQLLNQDSALEREAEAMGQATLQGRLTPHRRTLPFASVAPVSTTSDTSRAPVQRQKAWGQSLPSSVTSAPTRQQEQDTLTVNAQHRAQTNAAAKAHRVQSLIRRIETFIDTTSGVVDGSKRTRKNYFPDFRETREVVVSAAHRWSQGPRSMNYHCLRRHMNEPEPYMNFLRKIHPNRSTRANVHVKLQPEN